MLYNPYHCKTTGSVDRGWRFECEKVPFPDEVVRQCGARRAGSGVRGAASGRRALSGFFRENRQLGSRDRQFISESVYALLRGWGVLRKFLPEERRAGLESGEIRIGRVELDALIFAALYLEGTNLQQAGVLAAELGIRGRSRSRMRHPRTWPGRRRWLRCSGVPQRSGTPTWCRSGSFRCCRRTSRPTVSWPTCGGVRRCGCGSRRATATGWPPSSRAADWRCAAIRGSRTPSP